MVIVTRAVWGANNLQWKIRLHLSPTAFTGCRRVSSGCELAWSCAESGAVFLQHTGHQHYARLNAHPWGLVCCVYDNDQHQRPVSLEDLPLLHLAGGKIV